MLIKVPVLQRVWKVTPKSVLHIGAHVAEELIDYEKANWGEDKVYFIEAQESLATELQERISSERVKVINAVVWGKSGIKKTFHITSNSESSSLLNLKEHSRKYPQIKEVYSYLVSTSRVDDLIPDRIKFDFVNLDIQGAELEALKGLGLHALNVDWIYTEINKIELYEGCALVGQLDAYLDTLGFFRADTCWVPGKGWGDALYLRKRSLRWISLRRVASVLLRSPFYMRSYVSQALSFNFQNKLIEK
jgi:FkbM family methyltransferase